MFWSFVLDIYVDRFLGGMLERYEDWRCSLGVYLFVDVIWSYDVVKKYVIRGE